MRSSSLPSAVEEEAVVELPCLTVQAEEEEEEEEGGSGPRTAEAVGVPPSTANRAGAAGEEAAGLQPLEPAEVEAGVEPRCLEAPVGAAEEEAGTTSRASRRHRRRRRNTEAEQARRRRRRRRRRSTGRRRSRGRRGRG